MKWLLLLLIGCSNLQKPKTVDYVDLERFMGKWYVITGRTSFMEKGAHASVEKYSWNKEKKRIDIDFTFRKDSLNGKLKSIPQKAWIENTETNAHWKVQPFWPLKFDYLVIALGPNYEWTAIGVPDQKYLWIMARKSHISDEELSSILKVVSKTGYDIQDLKNVPQP
jgi:apolipoprotein D and lipocalin family protein